MDGHSSHLTAPVRSRSSQSPSPSHSASASATSSIHKRKLQPDDHAPPFPPSFSDTRDGPLTSNDDLESNSVRGADSDSDEESEEVVDDEEEEYDNSMRNFTASRLESSNTAAAARNTKIKVENSVKVEPSDTVKEGNLNSSGAAAATGANGSVPGIAVKEDTVKSIFTDNIQTSGAYSAREESLKREVSIINLSNFILGLVFLIYLSYLEISINLIRLILNASTISFGIQMVWK